jgi:hypothetical protein
LFGKIKPLWVFVCIAILLADYPAGLLFARQKKADPNTIILKLVDGRTGFPIWRENPNIWLGDASIGGNPWTNWKGEIVAEVRNATPRTIRFLPNWYADCRYKGDVTTGAAVEYSIEEIQEVGVVGKNVCGKRHASPVPGVLLLYVRGRTLREKWEL